MLEHTRAWISGARRNLVILIYFGDSLTLRELKPSLETTRALHYSLGLARSFVCALTLLYVLLDWSVLECLHSILGRWVGFLDVVWDVSA